MLRSFHALTSGWKRRLTWRRAGASTLLEEYPIPGPLISRPHWSFSQLSQFLRCPLQYYFDRVLRLPKAFTPSSLALGAAVHEALAVYHRQLREHLPIDRKAVLEAAWGAWRQIDSERPVRLNADETRAEMHAQAESLIDAYLLEAPPESIVAIEELLLSPVQNSNGEILERPLATIIDLLSRESEGLRIHEFKTSAKRLSQFDVDASLQATSYVMAIDSRFGAQAAVHYTVLVKTKRPGIQRLTTARGLRDFGRLGDTIQAVERAIESEAFYPIENPMNCSSCAFRKACRDWQGGRTLKASVSPAEVLMAC